MNNLPDVVRLTTEPHYTPYVVYVRGHHKPGTSGGARALEAAADYLRELAEEGKDAGEVEDWTYPRLGIGRRMRARWDHEQGLYLSIMPGWGSFPVTEILDLDQRDAMRAEQDTVTARAVALIAAVRDCYSEAADVEVELYGYPHGKGVVRFRLPGLAGRLSWCTDTPADVWVEKRDEGMFRERYFLGRHPILPTTEPTP